MKPKNFPLAARIKKLMQADEDVGKISQATPVLIGEATWPRRGGRVDVAVATAVGVGPDVCAVRGVAWAPGAAGAARHGLGPGHARPHR